MIILHRFPVPERSNEYANVAKSAVHDGSVNEEGVREIGMPLMMMMIAMNDDDDDDDDENRK